MVSVNVPGMHGWSNPYASLPGAFGHSLWQKGGLPAPFLFGRRVAVMADHMGQRAGTVTSFRSSVMQDFPMHPPFLVRLQLLPCMESLPEGRNILWFCRTLAFSRGWESVCH